jgi:hypothetical protein
MEPSAWFRSWSTAASCWDTWAVETCGGAGAGGTGALEAGAGVVVVGAGARVLDGATEAAG